MWENIEPGIPYLVGGQRVAFAKDVLKVLSRVDPRGKHWKAIEKGRVAPRGQSGLVPSEVRGYALKTKVLGQGGDVRVHGRRLEDGTLFFDLITRH